MNSIHNGWFSELGTLWPGQAMSIEMDKVLYHEKSEYQDILVFNSKTYGRVLVLDGVIQLTERDEFSYQEMITHLPLCSHPNGTVESVLVIGGGDGGVVRELLRHPEIKEVHLCEIDEAVVRIAKQFFPAIANGFNDPRVHVHHMDGFVFLKQHVKQFDVVICDSSDPVGPAESLFKKEFYQRAFESLKDDGILCTQAECLWLHLDLIREMSLFIREVFPSVDYGYTSIPTYPSGQIGFFLCSKKQGHSCKKPVKKLDPSWEQQLKYYTPEIHEAAFVLPAFAKRKILL